MENRINIAELLKDCPSGMELDCVMYDNLYFKCIREHPMYPIVCYTIDSKGEEYEISFNWYGKYAMIDTSKCIIFPKGKNTWEGFHRPFKKGDIIYTKHKLGTEFVSIFQIEYGRDICTYWDINLSTNKLIGYLHDGKAFKVFIEKDKVKEQRFATEEEKQKLFKAFKDNGYTWNAETKTLEKLIQPKFKVEDVVISDYGDIHLLRTEDSSYCAYRHIRKNKLDSTITTNITVVRLATEEEKEKLFDAIKENGYRWNTETKTLDKLPKFKVGDKVHNFIDDENQIITDAIWDGDEVLYKTNGFEYFHVNSIQPYKEETTEEKNNNNWAKWDLPDGYEFQDEEGNIIKTGVIKLVKKQPQYPKTYDECCEVLNTHLSNVTRPIGWKENLISKFQELIICRDAYWKIAGEQMGLGKPWKPYNGQESCKKYVIQTVYGKVTCLDTWCQTRNILEFPTAEIRDSFYENFKELIELCKELL